MPAEGFRQVVIHSLGENPCGETAFFLVTDLQLGDNIHPVDFELLDGSTPDWGDLMLCGSCGAQVYGVTASYETGFGVLIQLGGV